MQDQASPPAAIDPHYFGPAGPDLFGCYHAPAAASPIDCGVLLCNPHGHELIQFHRSIRRLATLLAEAGFPVLRFDFSGCGDSAGDDRNWSLEGWCDDVRAAARHLSERSGTRRLCVVGMRLGGAVAALAGRGGETFENMVLWDPVVVGRDYLGELNAMHVDMLRHAHVIPDPNDRAMEVLGFPVPNGFRDELEGFDLTGLSEPPAERIFLVESHPSPQERLLRGCFEGCGAREVRYRQLTNPHLWAWLEDFGRVHVPFQILQEVVRWISRTCA